MLPFLNSGKKKKRKSSPKKKETKKSAPKEESRMAKLGEAVIDYSVVRPTKAVGNMIVSGLMKELPEIGMLTNLLADMASDMSDIFKKNKKPSGEKPEQSPQNMQGTEVKSAIDSMREELEKQTHILSSDLSDIKIELGLLENIYGEIRTLSKITAKVWDVQDKTLRDMRYRQKQQASIERKRLFKARVAQTSHTSLEDKLNQDTEKPETKQKGFFQSILGDNLLEVIKSSLGIGAGANIGGKITKVLLGSIGSILGGIFSGSFLKTLIKMMGTLLFSKAGIAAMALYGGYKLGGIAVESGVKAWEILTSKEFWEDVTYTIKTAFEDLGNFMSDIVDVGLKKMKNTVSGLLDFLTESIKKRMGITPTATTEKVVPISDLLTRNFTETVQMVNGKPEYVGANNFEELMRKPAPEGSYESIIGKMAKPEKGVSWLEKQNYSNRQAEALEVEKAKEDIMNNTGSNTVPVIIQPQQINAPTTNTNNSRTNINVQNAGSWREKQIMNLANGFSP